MLTQASITIAFAACAPTRSNAPSLPVQTRRWESQNSSTFHWDRLLVLSPRPLQDFKLVSRPSLLRIWTRWATRRTPTSADKTRDVTSTPNKTEKLSTVSNHGPTLFASAAASTLTSRRTARTLRSRRRSERRKSNRSSDPSKTVIHFTRATISASVWEMAHQRRPTSKRWRKTPCNIARTSQRAFGGAWPTVRAWWTQPRWTTLATLAMSAVTSSEETAPATSRSHQLQQYSAATPLSFPAITVTITPPQIGRESLTNNFANDKTRLKGQYRHTITH